MIECKKIVFHGTTDLEFTKFSNDKIGRGGDGNSTLGIFFAEDPYLAADMYAENGMVIVAAIPDKPCLIVDLEKDIFNESIMRQVNNEYLENGCLPWDYPPGFDFPEDHKVFCHHARKYYRKKGIKVLQYAHIGDDQQMCVVLNANDIEILCVLTPEQAMKLSDKLHHLPDFYDQEKRWLLLQEIKPMVGNSLRP